MTVMTKRIYVNGKTTNIENIFDMVKNKQWYQVTASDIGGRSIKNVLDEWVKTKKTYYYINGKRIDFELK